MHRFGRRVPATGLALVAAVAALGGVAVGRATDAGIGDHGVVRACLEPGGSLHVIRTGEHCASGERLLLLREAGDLVTDEAPVAFASRTGKGRPIRGRWTAITSNALPKGAYAVHGAVRIDHRGRVARDVRIRCGLRRPQGSMITASVIAATFEKGDAGDVALPISVTIDHMRAGRLTLGCKEVPNGGSRARAAGPGSPGVISGNIVEQPVRIPVNVCGNTVNPVGGLNPASGNTCVNDK